MLLAVAKLFRVWWPGTESNRRRQPFQGCALPTELPGRESSCILPDPTCCCAMAHVRKVHASEKRIDLVAGLNLTQSLRYE